MQDLFNGFESGSDAGRSYVELRVPFGMHMVAAMTVEIAIAVAAPLLMRDMLGGVTWAITGVALAGAVTTPFLLRWVASRLRLRVSFDGTRRVLSIDGASLHREIAYADIAQVRMATRAQERMASDTDARSGTTISVNTMTYAIEFVLRSGETVAGPAGTYGQGDVGRVIDAINRELGARAAMAG